MVWHFLVTTTLIAPVRGRESVGLPVSRGVALIFLVVWAALAA